MVEDAADDAAFGYEGDDPHHAPTAGTDERVVQGDQEDLSRFGLYSSLTSLRRDD